MDLNESNLSDGTCFDLSSEQLDLNEKESESLDVNEKNFIDECEDTISSCKRPKLEDNLLVENKGKSKICLVIFLK